MTKHAATPQQPMTLTTTERAVYDHIVETLQLQGSTLGLDTMTQLVKQIVKMSAAGAEQDYINDVRKEFVLSVRKHLEKYAPDGDTIVEEAPGTVRIPAIDNGHHLVQGITLTIEQFRPVLYRATLDDGNTATDPILQNTLDWAYANVV